MQHMVNKEHIRWVAANLISGHLVHAGNHKHGTVGNSLPAYYRGGVAKRYEA